MLRQRLTRGLCMINKKCCIIAMVSLMSILTLTGCKDNVKESDEIYSFAGRNQTG